MQTRILEKVARYEENLRDIPLDKLKIEYDGYSDTVRFINTESGELYKGELFDKRTGYRHDWTSSFVYTLIGEKTNYYLKHEEVRGIVKNYLNMSYMQKRKKIRFYLRVDSDNDVFGLVSSYFNFTDKLELHKFIIEAISIENGINENAIVINEKIVKYGKIFVEYKVQNLCKFSMEYGYDNGFSCYRIYQYDNYGVIINLKEWRHNDRIRIIFDLILDSITKRQVVLNIF
jgi:hypothetical protein